jgi:hypothetical protein
VLVAAGGLAAWGCHSRAVPGESCRVADQVVCTSRDRALVCDAVPSPSPSPSPSPEGPSPTTPSSAAPPATSPLVTSASNAPMATAERIWVDLPCRGAHGCGRSGAADDDDCDDTLASEGDLCPRSPPLDYACASDHASALTCRDGRFGLWRRCRGPLGCQVVDGRNVHCDTSLGEAGDPCERPGTYACSVDGRSMLACDGKSLSVVSVCRGPKACFFEHGEPGSEPHKIDCDDGVADEGDPCSQPRRITCALDHKAELVCDGQKFAKKRECRRSDCRIDGTELFCD